MSSKPKRGLGRGLESLLGSGAPARLEAQPGDTLREIPLDQLHAGRHQPRRAFDDVALAELAESIRAQGVVQPIVVRPTGANQYEIVAGERRWRAARLAGLSTVPSVVRTLDERGAMAAALVENIQRSDLNPLEESAALKKLIEECGYTHEACAEAVGRKRATVTNLLRLMELNEDVQQLVREDKLSLGHAKVLLGVSGPRQSSLSKLVVNKELSVRATEALVQAEGQTKTSSRPLPRPFTKLEGELGARLGGLPVKIDQARGGTGKLVISFRNMGELERLVSLIR
jgi:ParB family chromosome partitioning protein